jgi:hypothetical protein
MMILPELYCFHSLVSRLRGTGPRWYPAPWMRGLGGHSSRSGYVGASPPFVVVVAETQLQDAQDVTLPKQ